MTGRPPYSGGHVVASAMRALASKTRFPEVRARLLLMAAGFERLADQVEKWENERLARAAD